MLILHLEIPVSAASFRLEKFGFLFSMGVVPAPPPKKKELAKLENIFAPLYNIFMKITREKDCS